MAPKRIKVKPGKTQSKIAFAVSVMFVLIGCVIAIPAAGLFGIIWTAAAAMIAYNNYKNAFSDNGVATHEIVIEDDADTPCVSGEDDIEAKLIKLNSLYEKGLITQEEYEGKRKDILRSF